jgi:predicted lysophospholipase L1 biosynthesis ABC-type transport system permease subunit
VVLVGRQTFTAAGSLEGITLFGEDDSVPVSVLDYPPSLSPPVDPEVLVNVEIQCAPSERCMDEWRIRIYAAVMRAYQERLAAYHAVESTYLATFQALGGFGLLLGTLGLGIALLRGLLERRGELALLRSVGFRRRRIAWMVLAENGVLLLLGVGIGTVAGLLAVAPHLSAGGGAIPWASLLGTLAGLVAAGLLSCAAALRSALAAPLVPVLKEER